MQCMNYERLYSPDTKVVCKTVGEDISATHIAEILKNKFLENDIFLQEGDHFILGKSQYFIVLVSPVVNEGMDFFEEIQFTVETVEM